MSQATDTVERFYAAFDRHDGAAMTACYAPDATFHDEVFDLRGPQVTAMWRMLVGNSTDLRVVLSNVREEGNVVRGHWQATYTFSVTGRKVVNEIDAEIELRNGLIVRHVDRFDFYKWSRMALGVPGALLGWAPFFNASMRKRTARMLDNFMRKEGASPAA